MPCPSLQAGLTVWWAILESGRPGGAQDRSEWRALAATEKLVAIAGSAAVIFAVLAVVVVAELCSCSSVSEISDVRLRCQKLLTLCRNFRVFTISVLSFYKSELKMGLIA